MSTQTVTKPSLTLKRRLNSPPAKVFSAWTDPEKIKRWFGPGQTQVALAEFDTRVGGRFRIVATSDGEEHHVTVAALSVRSYRTRFIPGRGEAPLSASRW